MDIEGIRSAFRTNQAYFTDHALRRLIQRGISDEEVYQAILVGMIIEEYPDDKYGPSCLIYGRTADGRVLHVQCSLPPRVRVVTLYEPDPQEWVDGRTRKKSI